jgi:WhiB family transcriptional regulator, redox-sensing transcriptional regulator
VDLPLDRFPWMSLAACRDHPDPDLFFPGRGRNDLTQKAREVCGACSVQNACLTYAVLRHESVGVWGGTSPNERTAIRNVLKSWGHSLQEERALSESAACAAS